MAQHRTSVPLKLAATGVSLALIAACTTKTSPADQPADKDPTPEKPRSVGSQSSQSAANGVVMNETIPTGIVFDQATNEFLVETRAYTNTVPPIYPGVLDIETVIDGERFAGLIPPASTDDAADSIRYWTPISRLHFQDQRWVIDRHGTWTQASMKRRSPDYEAGNPVRVWVRKLYHKNDRVPFYMFTVESTSVPID